MLLLVLSSDFKLIILQFQIKICIKNQQDVRQKINVYFVFFLLKFSFKLNM